ncbi:MAG: putative transposase [Cognaticolwellia sp.]
MFTKEMLEYVNEIMKETCLQMDCELLEFGGEENHIHLVVSAHPKV